MTLQYNPLENNFTEYKNTEELPTILPTLTGNIDISGWAEGITNDGKILLKDTFTPNIEEPMEIENPTESVIPVMEPPTPQSKPSVKSTPMSNDKKFQAYNFFLSKGASVFTAAGIVGNLIQESSLNTTIKGDGGKARGIAQWHPDRFGALEKYAKRLGEDPDSYETQLKFVWEELTTKYPKTFRAMQLANNVDLATKIFMEGYERPNKKYALLENRIRYAKSVIS